MTIWYGATTVTVAATDVVRPSDWNSAHYQFMSATGNTAGQSTFSGTNIVFGGGPNVTLSGVNATRIDISAAAGGGGAVVSNAIQSVGSATGSGTNTSRFAADDHVHAGVFSIGVSTGGNTAGDTRVDVGRFVFAGVNAVSLSQGTAANALNTVSVVGPASATTVSAVASANTVGTRGSRFALEDHQHEGVFSVGVSTGGNTLGDTRVGAGRFVFAGGNNITLSQGTAANALNTVTIVGPTQTNQTGGIYVTAQSTGQSSSSTYDVRTLSIIPDGIISAGWSNGSFRISATQSNQAFSAAGGASAFQTLSFSDNAYASWTNNAGQVAVTELRGSFFATSNTTQSSSGTQNLDAITFAGAGIASVGVTNGSIVISVPAGGGGGDGGVFAGVSTGGNTAGSTGTVSTGNFVLVGSNGITLSQSTAGAGSHATVTINGGWVTYSRHEFVPLFEPQGFGSVGLAQNTLYIWPIVLEAYITGDAVNFPVAMTNSSSAASSGRRGQTIQFGVYTRNSTNSTVLTRHYSTSYTIAASYSSNVSMAASIITGIGNSTSYNTTAISSAGLNISQSVHGARELIMPFSTLLTPGEYWLALLNSTSSAGTQGAILTINNWIHSMAAANRLGVSISSATDAWGRTVMQGVYTTTTGAMPAGISQTQINQSGLAPVVRFGVQTA